MNWAIYVDVAVGLALSLAVLVMAIAAGREAAVHRVLWIVGLVLLSLIIAISSAAPLLPCLSMRSAAARVSAQPGSLKWWQF